MSKLSKNEIKELKKIKRIAKGTPITIKRVSPGSSNVIIGGFGTRVVKQLGGNVGLSATTVVSAKARIFFKDKIRKINKIQRK